MTLSPARAGNLVARVSEALRAEITEGRLKPGDRLPSEARLTEAHGVSRTVVREAIAALRADRLVEARQGAGVFVLEAPVPERAPFQNIDYVRLSSMIEMLELRTAVEMEAAGLAATRRSAQQEERIIDAYRAVSAAIAAGEPTTAADYDLHLAIAEATNNPRFPEFLAMVGGNVIPRQALQNTGPAAEDAAPQPYLVQIQEEHDRIVTAILAGDEEGARQAMRVHLRGAQGRYRMLLRG
ncbi:FadR/GntR family transcriptional regulator [Falsirhodobacter sp. 20TX0035]|uniref:FadR/GntR family transcriptional regulator n=1 Tax=Falsirhodobacter sp. 20TX0035 TaxID=3022019 RepID=UPI00232DAA56|nr:FadR/GntR family transcriptional regulator [Falsirhodobacter sp. 20TX0035]MDB6452845.1 FadR/GntR family transcriptional regulator [Falsirhodobacter sp. 20TX0035]